MHQETYSYIWYLCICLLFSSSCFFPFQQLGDMRCARGFTISIHDTMLVVYTFTIQEIYLSARVVFDAQFCLTSQCPTQNKRKTTQNSKSIAVVNVKAFAATSGGRCPAAAVIRAPIRITRNRDTRKNERQVPKMVGYSGPVAYYNRGALTTKNSTTG